MYSLVSLTFRVGVMLP